MIDKICTFLTNRIRKKMPDIDDEKAEVINYGLQNIVGEIPKIFIMLGVAYILGVFKLALFTFLALLPFLIRSEMIKITAIERIALLTPKHKQLD